MKTSIGAYIYLGIIDPILDANENYAFVLGFVFRVIKTIFSISYNRNLRNDIIVN